MLMRLIYRSLDWTRLIFFSRRRLWNQEKLTTAIDKVDDVWRVRTELAMESSDNADIPRLPEAGNVKGHWITMHNGIEVLGLGYYGAGMAHLLVKNRGVHEPQEEKLFQQVLPSLRKGAVMMELGAYWGFYSLWFLKNNPGGTAYLVEPNPENLMVGKENFLRNSQQGTFLRGFIGGRPGWGERAVRVYTVDELMQKWGIEYLDVLHADIQRAERDMLDGAQKLINEKRVGYVFISTHTSQLHDACESYLEGKGFEILASANMDETYSIDGLIVARAPWHKGIGPVEISHRRADS